MADFSEPTPLELQRSLAEAAAGSEAAWERIVRWFTPRVFALIRANCGNADLAEEITQSTFCTVAAKLDRYVESGRFEGWIFRIAMNRLRDEMRRRKRHAVPVEDSTLMGLSPGTLDAAPVDRPRLFAALAEAVGRLSPADRQMIELRHLGGLSFRQMADLLEEPIGTLLARHHRALRKLREHLGPEIAAEVEDLA
jgi:RNA polymerase sigma-70 factor (ECF subfamily)